MAKELKDTTTDPGEAMRQADKNAGLPAAATKVQAPADAIDLQAGIEKADETPVEGLAKLVRLQKAKDDTEEKAEAQEMKETKPATSPTTTTTASALTHKAK